MGNRVQEMIGKKSWIAHAMKNQHGEGDINEKYRVLMILRDYFDLRALMNNANDMPLFFNKFTGACEDPPPTMAKENIQNSYFIHYPDLGIKNHKQMIVVEIDGKAHWQSSGGVARTNKRNFHYDNAGLHLIWLTDIEARDKIQRELILNITEKLQPLGLKPRLLPAK